jgi:hypothetical protein
MVLNPANYLKNRMLQSNYMFLVLLPLIPSGLNINGISLPIPNLISGYDAAFLIRSTSIPGISNEIEIVNTNNNRFTLPKKIKIEHEWSTKVLMSQDHLWYDTLVQWYKNVHFGIAGQVSFKAPAAFIVLLDQEYIPTKVIQLAGLYPSNVPELSELNYESIENMIELDCKFTFDDINFDENNLLPTILNLKGSILDMVGLRKVATMGF